MYKKLIAVFMVLIMGLSALSSLAEAPAEDPVLATVNGKEITKSQVDAEIVQMLNNQFVDDETQYATVLQFMVNRELITKKIADLGFDQFTKEEEDAFLSEAQQQLDKAIETYADYYQSADSEKAREDAVAQARDSFAAQGVTVELIAQDVKNRAGLDRLNEYLLGGYEPSLEEVQSVFQEVGGMYKQQFENDIAQYEYMTQYGGQNSWFTPEGYRSVVHILLKADDALLENYKALNAAFEEQQQHQDSVPVENGAEATEQPAEEKKEVTQQMLDEARQAVLDSKKADIDQIYERLNRGESFIDLIKEYGEDPGMTVPSNLEEGYAVHAQSILYDPAFTAAAFSEKMQKVGDVSDPAVSTFGIHILHYLRDLPSGLELTDAIRQEIEDYLTAKKQNEVFQQALTTWAQQEQIVYFQEAIDAATAQAQQRINPQENPEEQPLEAAPTEGEGQTP
ncbi:MAG TPA: hypothetical protein GX006_07130 [Clostridiales bacterium]|jgi:hypothetical protein|nr:hypothetical protein [Clostridiales bacterium]